MKIQVSTARHVCLSPGQVLIVKRDQRGPYVTCALGKHYLDQPGAIEELQNDKG